MGKENSLHFFSYTVYCISEEDSFVFLELWKEFATDYNGTSTEQRKERCVQELTNSECDVCIQ